MKPAVTSDVTALLRLVKHLFDRPPLLRLPSQQTRSDLPLPIVALHPRPTSTADSEPASSLLATVRDAFAHTSSRVPFVYLDASKPSLRSGQVRLPLLCALTERLSASEFGLGRAIRFDLFRLAYGLTKQNIDDAPGDDVRRKVVHLLRRRHRFGDETTTSRLFDAVPHWTGKLVLLLFAGFWPLSRFWLWLGGRVPGLGRQTRWFLKQPFMPPKQGNDFLGFAYRLTAPRHDEENADELDKLLVHAFLEDLRHAYRRRPWKLHPWRRTAYPTVLLDNIDRVSGGWRLLDLINDVRNETGELDPLLVVAAGGERPPRVTSDKYLRPLDRAADALDAWRLRLPLRRRLKSQAAWFLPLTFGGSSATAGSGVSQNIAADFGPVALLPRRAPLLARRSVVTLSVAVLLGAGLAPGYPYASAGCYPFTTDGISVIVDHGECLGYSDSTRQVFGSDRLFPDRSRDRLRNAQQDVFEQNEIAERLHEARPGRPLVSVVYFAGLTRPPGSPDSDAAQAEELEGLLLRQGQQNDEPGFDPLLRVIVANGGANMRAADTVARDMLVPLAQRDPTVIGVVGMDRSIGQTQRAITHLGVAGIPVVATTLSGDGIGDGSSLYFQIVPPNTTQAKLLTRFAKAENKRHITIYHPRTRGDVYVETLVNDVTHEARTAGLKTTRKSWRDSGSSPRVTPACDDDEKSELAFYAGRHNQFADFLANFNKCRDDPTIVAADSATRFVADKRQREENSQLAGLEVHYVSKAGGLVINGQECVAGKLQGEVDRLAGFCAEFLRKFGADPDLLWPGERVGLAYDAAGLFLDATKLSLGRQHITGSPNRATVAHEFREPEFPLEGVTGPIDFTRSRITTGKGLAILRIENIFDTGSQPECAYLIEGMDDHGEPDLTNDCPR